MWIRKKLGRHMMIAMYRTGWLDGGISRIRWNQASFGRDWASGRSGGLTLNPFLGCTISIPARRDTM